MDATQNTTTVTVAQAAEALAVSERTVWRYLKSGRLTGETVGEPGAQRTLIRADAVDALTRARSGTGELAAVRAERDRLAGLLSAACAERDALHGRVAALQSALARTAGAGRLERMLGGAMAAVGRVRTG
ncbi:helix-turn-helix domain-containing protein [Mycolicibacterium sp.]|uniref:helix-turn-helix domain-containing protein n=1 Tax=Mycolicibacterium sp. TaxID=2320850 RepID=UPI0037C80CBF